MNAYHYLSLIQNPLESTVKITEKKFYPIHNELEYLQSVSWQVYFGKTPYIWSSFLMNNQPRLKGTSRQHSGQMSQNNQN